MEGEKMFTVCMGREKNCLLPAWDVRKILSKMFFNGYLHGARKKEKLLL